MKLDKDDKLVIQFGKIYKNKNVVIHIFKTLLILNDKIGLSKGEIKRLQEQGGIKVYYEKS